MTPRQGNQQASGGWTTGTWILTPQRFRRGQASPRAGFAGISKIMGFLFLALAAGIVFLPLTATRVSAQETTHTYSVLYSFTGGADGGFPDAGLIADGAGNLYGTTHFGGSSSCANGSIGCGVVFKLDPLGNETLLHTFTGGADGNEPSAALVRDAAGNLYGTTPYGGNTGGNCSSSLCGVVFKLDPLGNETVLYSFTLGADGGYPWGGVIRDASGNLYGTTVFGGAYGYGVVFKLDPLGNETVLYSFTHGADGAFPYSGLIRDGAGNLYGTTSQGGNTSNSCPNGGSFGCGVVFELDPAGNETVLYAFPGGASGWSPEAGLVRDRAGNLYGTTPFGGQTTGRCFVPSPPAAGCGVVFKLDPSGNETVLHTFTQTPDGSGPNGGLLRDRAGNLYGTTSSGGTSNAGILFKLDPAGKETLLYSFTGGTDGHSPVAGLAQYKGSLYGTTENGGAYGNGVVFKLH